MSWNRPSIQTIYNRIKADLESYASDGVSVPRVSLLGIMNMVFSGAIHLCYGFLNWICKQIFVDTASEYGLQRWGNILELPRKAATYSSGYVEFTGTGTVDEGTVLVNSEGYEFETQDDFLIGTDDEVEVVAVVAGSESNCDDEYLTLSSPIGGIDSEAMVLDVLDDGTVPPILDNGTALETVEAWVYRLLFRFRNPPSSGNEGDYVRWALEVSGVGRAWCIPAQIWEAGSLAVFVGTYNMTPVSAGILSAVQDYIEAKKPIPAHVDYFTIGTAPIDFTIAISPNNQNARDAINEELETLFLLEAIPGGELLISHVRQAIMASGIDDYEITYINVVGPEYGPIDPDDNIETNYPDVPTYSPANYTDL